MSEISARNEAVKFYVNTRIEVAQTKSREDFPEFNEGSEIDQLLTDLIEVKTKGFRGIVITALVGIHLDDDYDPLNNFYQCNPRAIFEQGIWYVLQEHRIPCGKSDPLNVAKNAHKLNQEWAQGRRPQRAAMAVVKFLSLVLKANQNKRARLIDYFFFRLWQYAQGISDYQLVQISTSQKAKLEIGEQIINFTLCYPESGQLPQFLIAQLLQAIFKNSSIQVCGRDQSVFSTNTTSHKPSDLWLEERGQVTNLYEITVKKVSQKRLDDSLESLQETGYLNSPVTFICRIPEDVVELNLLNNRVIYRDKNFEFIDYQQFCLSLLVLLSDQAVDTIMINFFQLVNDIQISMTTKIAWNEVFGSWGREK